MSMRFSTLLCTLSLALSSLVTTLALAGDITWIDVRTVDEFNQHHVTGAINIPYEEIDSGIARLGLEKDSMIYLYCKSGRRAGLAKDLLEELGYTRVVNIGGLDAALAQAAKSAQ